MYKAARHSPFFTGDALYAMELSLSLEKLNFDKLLHLWEVGGSLVTTNLSAQSVARG